MLSHRRSQCLAITGSGIILSAQSSLIQKDMFPRSFTKQIHSASGAKLQYIRNDFTNQPFTGVYEPGQPTVGPLSNIPLRGQMDLTPRELKKHLDQFVIGQERAKKVISTAVFNHYQRVLDMRRQDEEEYRILQQRLRSEKGRRDALEDENTGNNNAVSQPHVKEVKRSDSDGRTSYIMEKSNILLLGPSGVGKTLIAKTIARVLDVPFSMSDCTPFTQAGYVGEDVQLCVERLLIAADYDVEAAESGIIVLDEVDKIAAQRTTQGRDVGGEGVQQALLKIIEGTTLHIQVKAGVVSSSNRGNSTIGNITSTASSTQSFSSKYSSNLSGIMGTTSMSSQKNETLSIKTDNILFIFTGAFVGLHKHIISRIRKGSIGFANPIRDNAFSEIDSHQNLISIKPNSEERRLFSKHLPSSATEYSSEATTKHNFFDLVDHIDLQSYGMIPELVGRIPIVTAVSNLDESDLIRVLVEPRNNLIKQYEHLFSLSGIELKFTTEALSEVAKAALRMNTGARALRTCVEKLLSEAMFETPGSSVKHILITGEVARGEQAPIYLARGQKHKFQSLIASAEDTYANDSKTQGIASNSDSYQNLKPYVKNFEEYRVQNTVAGYS